MDAEGSNQTVEGPPGSLTRHMAAFESFLVEQGYAAPTRQRHMEGAKRLCGAVDQSALQIATLDEQQVLDLGVCRSWEHATARLFLRHLRAAGIVERVVRPSTPIDLLIEDYERYLRSERGLSRASVATYLAKVRLFLDERFEDQVVATDQIAPRDLASFIRRHAHQHSLHHAKNVVKSLRSFLGFLTWRGDVTAALAAAVPSVADWGLNAVPRSIRSEEVERVLDGCDRQGTVGIRDYAIVMVLARLGLRAGEVARLTLDDLDWQGARITVAGKGQRHERLPLTDDVGRALVDYLRQGRPPRAIGRAVFVRTAAPHRGLSSAAITSVAHRALLRADIEAPRLGAHLFRHSLATAMLRNGAKLSEIGQVLRHHQIHTTEIYAKVDIEQLRTVAQPWPAGGAS